MNLARVSLTDYSELVPLMERNILHNQLQGEAVDRVDLVGRKTASEKGEKLPGKLGEPLLCS